METRLIVLYTGELVVFELLKDCKFHVRVGDITFLYGPERGRIEGDVSLLSKNLLSYLTSYIENPPD